MNIIRGTVPHFIKVHMGGLPDGPCEGTAEPYIPLDESSDGVAKRLAVLARALVKADQDMGGSCSGARVINVDGTDCSIPVSQGADLETAISCLVAPQGWGNI
jgi:hypothetical protein